MYYEVQIKHPSGLISKMRVEATHFSFAVEYAQRNIHPSLEVVGVIYLATENGH